eukprot:9185431-Alexandrium_andersonii.AAC.1
MCIRDRPLHRRVRPTIRRLQGGNAPKHKRHRSERRPRAVRRLPPTSPTGRHAPSWASMRRTAPPPRARAMAGELRSPFRLLGRQ